MTVKYIGSTGQSFSESDINSTRFYSGFRNVICNLLTYPPYERCLMLKEYIKTERNEQKTMRGTFELVDYADRSKALDNPRVVVMDAGPGDNDMVRIRIGSEEHGYQTVKVVGKELILAAENCMRINYPYV